MTETALFIRLLTEKDKAVGLSATCSSLRQGNSDQRCFEVNPDSFREVPGAPFAYWVSEAVRGTFQRLPAFESDGRTVRQGLATADDFRFVRASWEIPQTGLGIKWFGFAKGGAFSPFYADVHLVVNWWKGGSEIKEGICQRYPYLNGNPDYVAKNTDFYLRPGLTWPRRTTSGLSMRIMPADCIFADKGPAAFVVDDSPDELLVLLSTTSSAAFQSLVELQLAAADAAARSYEVGVIKRTPVPALSAKRKNELAAFSRRAWSLKRTLDTIEETSHAFLLPAALRPRLDDYHPSAITEELARIQAEIDDIAFDLYGFSETDREAVTISSGMVGDGADSEEAGDQGDEVPADTQNSLLSWAVGVAFGRFDWRLATGEREPPPEPEPFDPLPAKSPGMLPDGAVPFHDHAGILVDDPGHPHDLARLVESVLERVEVPVPPAVRRWLQREFFKGHLKQYSKSRRKAPIYWPLSTATGSYTLWIYYPALSSQTLYTAINDFVEPKLKQVGGDLTALREKGSARTREDEKQFEVLQSFEQELIDLRDTLLQLAPAYKPNHDDGVQITAAPLWPLFRHKHWQKVLKDTWAKLEKGDYDWAHLAMNYWPERVREKCKTDKSLAIAHGLEDLYVEPEAKPKAKRGRKAKGS